MAVANPKRKGSAGEREAAGVLAAHGFEVVRVPYSGALRGQPGDLILPELDRLVEVKRCERAELWRWWLKLENECPFRQAPLLVMRRNRGNWLAVERLDKWMADHAIMLDRPASDAA